MDKKRLEDIKEKYSEFTVFGYINDIDIVGVDMKDLVWLINRIEELEQEVNNWRDEAIKWNKRFEESEESHLEALELLESILKQNKRYREALNSVITLWIASTDATDDTWLAHEMSETARKALDSDEN